MTYFVAYLIVFVVLFLGWLLFTKKIELPLLFDIGITSVIIGLFLVGESMTAHEEPNTKGTACILLGAALILQSLRRERKKRKNAMRHGEPHMIDGGSFRRQ